MKSYQELKKESKNYPLDKIEMNQQILFSINSGLIICRIVEVREKAVKIDFCRESVWSKGSIVVFTYTTWLPKSVIVNDEIGGLTIKKWFASNGLKSDKIRSIKKYYVKAGKQVFV